MTSIAKDDFCFAETGPDSWRLCKVVELKPPSGKDGKPSFQVAVVPSNDGPIESDKKTLIVTILKKLSANEAEAVRMVVDDLFNMQTQEPWTILQQTRMRYWVGKYFTNIGPILVAVNPYTDQLPLYAKERRQAYLTGTNDEPHVWEISRRVYLRLQKDRKNQCVLVSGESGSGKTYSIRLLTDFLADQSTFLAPDNEKAEAKRVADMQPKVGLVLEAFGNAKTRRNKDSSRFAKFAKLQFNEKGYLFGCLTECHLLECSRVVLHEKNERTFHIFYMLYSAMKDEFKLEHCVKWLFQGIPEKQWESAPDGKPTAQKQYEELVKAFAVLNTPQELISSIFNIVAGLMHMLCITFVPGTDETKSKLVESDGGWLELIAKLWGMDANYLLEHLTNNHLTVKNSTTKSPIPAVEANQKREALCKKVYQHLFDWLTLHLNTTCNGRSEKWIGVLDIFGFESFPRNSFEQFCINFANEKLQDYYSETTVELLNKYNAEQVKPPAGLDYKPPGNKEALSVIEKIINALDDYCSNTKSRPTMANLATSVFNMITAETKTVLGRPRPQDPQDKFSIRHYADNTPVMYSMDEFLAKNSSKVQRDVLEALSCSTNVILQSILTLVSDGSISPAGSPPMSPNIPNVSSADPFGFLDATSPNPPRSRSPGRGPGSGPAPIKPLAGNFKRDMERLLGTMSKEAGLENLHWIRCIKPNTEERPGVFNGGLVMKQLECVIPLLEIAKVSQDKWMEKQKFCDHYKILVRGLRNKPLAEQLEGLLTFVTKLPLSDGSPTALFQHGVHIQAGLTQICMHKSVYERLERLRDKRVLIWLLFIAGHLVTKGYRLYRKNWFKRESKKLAQLDNEARVQIWNEQDLQRARILGRMKEEYDDIINGRALARKREEEERARQEALERQQREEAEARERARKAAEEAERKAQEDLRLQQQREAEEKAKLLQRQEFVDAQEEIKRLKEQLEQERKESAAKQSRITELEFEKSSMQTKLDEAMLERDRVRKQFERQLEELRIESAEERTKTEQRYQQALETAESLKKQKQQLELQIEGNEQLLLDRDHEVTVLKEQVQRADAEIRQVGDNLRTEYEAKLQIELDRVTRLAEERAKESIDDVRKQLETEKTQYRTLLERQFEERLKIEKQTWEDQSESAVVAVRRELREAKFKFEMEADALTHKHQEELEALRSQNNALNRRVNRDREQANRELATLRAEIEAQTRLTTEKELSAAKQKWQLQKETELTRLRDTYDSQIRELRKQHVAEMQQLADRLTQEQESIIQRVREATEVKQKTATSNAWEEIESMRRQYEQQASITAAKHQQELREFERQLLEQNDEKWQKILDSKEHEKLEAVAQAAKDAEFQFKTELQRMRDEMDANAQEYERKTAEMYAEFERKRADLLLEADRDRSRAVESQRETSLASVAKLEQMFNSKWSDRETELKREHDESIRALREQHTAELDALRTQYQTQLRQMAATDRAEQSEYIRQLKESHRREIARLRARYTDAMYDLRANLSPVKAVLQTMSSSLDERFSSTTTNLATPPPASTSASRSRNRPTGAAEVNPTDADVVRNVGATVVAQTLFQIHPTGASTAPVPTPADPSGLEDLLGDPSVSAIAGPNTSLF